LEAEAARFCLNHQHDTVPAAIFDVIDPGLKEMNIDRFSVRNFAMWHEEQLCFQKATAFEKNRPNVCLDYIRRYFDTLGDLIRSIPSPFVWNMDDRRAGCQKKVASPEVIVATNTKFDFVKVPEARDDAQLALLTAPSAFGGSTYVLSLFPN
jgi:hypothetical protein